MQSPHGRSWLAAGWVVAFFFPLPVTVSSDSSSLGDPGRLLCGSVATDTGMPCVVTRHRSSLWAAVHRGQVVPCASGRVGVVRTCT